MQSIIFVESSENDALRFIPTLLHDIVISVIRKKSNIFTSILIKSMIGRYNFSENFDFQNGRTRKIQIFDSF